MVREVVEDDAEQILGLKVCQHAEMDLLGCNYNADGVYNIKSGYWLATHTLPERIEPPYGDVLLKDKEWKLQTTPKIKQFLWKLLTNAMAIGEFLRRRHMTQNSSCPRCCIAIRKKVSNICFLTVDLQFLCGDLQVWKFPYVFFSSLF